MKRTCQRCVKRRKQNDEVLLLQQQHSPERVSHCSRAKRQEHYYSNSVRAQKLEPTRNHGPTPQWELYNVALPTLITESRDSKNISDQTKCDFLQQTVEELTRRRSILEPSAERGRSTYEKSCCRGKQDLCSQQASKAGDKWRGSLEGLLLRGSACRTPFHRHPAGPTLLHYVGLTVFHGIFSHNQSDPLTFTLNVGLFCGILSVPHNIVMDLNKFRKILFSHLFWLDSHLF